MFALNHNEFLPIDKLKSIAQDCSENYREALPFAHGVYDDVFAPEILDKVIEEFDQGEKQWHAFETKYEKKFQMSEDVMLPPVTRAFIHNLNSEPFLRFLEELTGIEGLIPDPYLSGAGMHRIPMGGKLGVHVDFNRHSIMKVHRRLNLLIYLNKDWKEDYGGHFELWDQNKNACVKKVLPIYNRMALFTTTNTSFHGHPIPLTCPDGRSRISLALYYYTAQERGGQRLEGHGTEFLTEHGKREQLGLGLFGKAKRKAKTILLGR